MKCLIARIRSLRNRQPTVCGLHRLFYQRSYMDKLYVIKIGGEVVDDPSKLEIFFEQFASISPKKILVHGGGKLATELAEKLGLPQQMIEGRRVTDAETLKVAAMVYGGLINK